MAYIGNIDKREISLNLDSLTIEPTTFTEGVPKDYQGIRITHTNIILPAGALSVDILPLEFGKPITINGEPHYKNDRFHREMKKDENTNKVYYVKEITIVATGQYNIAVSYPEESTVDFVAIGLT